MLTPVELAQGWVDQVDADQLNVNLSGSLTPVDPKNLEAMTTEEELEQFRHLYQKALGQGD